MDETPDRWTIACRKVQWSPGELEILNAAGLTVIDPPPDATKGNCEKCRAEIWVGPRSRMVMTEHAEKGIPGDVLCIICAATETGRRREQDNAQIKIIGLGNPNW